MLAGIAAAAKNGVTILKKRTRRNSEFRDDIPTLRRFSKFKSSSFFEEPGRFSLARKKSKPKMTKSSANNLHRNKRGTLQPLRDGAGAQVLKFLFFNNHYQKNNYPSFIYIESLWEKTRTAEPVHRLDLPHIFL